MTVDELRRELNELAERGYGDVTVVVSTNGKEVLWQLEGDVGVDCTDPQDWNRLLLAEEDESTADNPNTVVVLV